MPAWYKDGRHERDDMPDYLEPDKPREEALEAAVRDPGTLEDVFLQLTGRELRE